MVAVAGTSGGTLTLFTDGEPTALAGSTFLTTSPSPASLVFGGGGFDGSVDEIKLWSRRLTLDEFTTQPGGAMFARDPALSPPGDWPVSSGGAVQAQP